ncbi:MAG: rod shape-determining protein MreC [Myxococcota bacterium]|jgi:rod shape-determining protein MreC
MREFLARHRAAIAAFLGLTLPLFLLFVHGRADRRTTVIEAALMEITAPVQGAAAKVLGGIGDIWDGYIALIDVEAEREQLEAEVRELKGRAGQLAQLEVENGKLRAMLNFAKARRDLTTLGGHVIGKNVSPYGRVLRVVLDVGDDANLSEGMPVINEDGLVGRIEGLSGNIAEVLLTVDARSTLNVKVLGKGVTGTVTGTNSETNYVARMSYLHKAEPLAVGDLIVTSGHDQVFPSGIRVGVIRSLEERQRGVEYVVDVNPTVNFSNIEFVSVVLGTADAEADKQAAQP